MADANKIVDALNDLITASYDAEKGYKESAEDVKDARLKSWFKEYAQQRYDFGHELKGEIAQLGGKVDKGTSLTGDAHRLWIDIKSALAGQDEKAVIGEVIRGEESSLSSYDDVLKHETLPASTRTVVTRQRSQIQAALSKVRELKAAFAAS